MADLKLETLAQAEQHLFEVVVRGLSAQGWKQSMSAQGWKQPMSKDPSTADCVWVSTDGCKCAIGHLLVDPPPYEKMRDQSISSALAYMPGELKRLRSSLSNEGHRRFIAYLQSLLMLHDSSPTPDSMQLAFQYLGKRRGLRWPEDVAVT